MTWGIWTTWTEHGAECGSWFRQRTGEGRRKASTFDNEREAQRFIDGLGNPDLWNSTKEPRELPTLDPNVLLMQLREAFVDCNIVGDELEVAFGRALDAFQALDDWLIRGEVFPDDWFAKHLERLVAARAKHENGDDQEAFIVAGIQEAIEELT